LVVKQVSKPTYDLEELLAGVTKKNQHGEIQAGERIWPKGKDRRRGCLDLIRGAADPGLPERFRCRRARSSPLND
jgi:hypothetical protein